MNSLFFLPVYFPLATLIFCFTLIDLQHSNCKVLCQRDGYTTGYHDKKQCVCSDAKGSIDDLVHRRVNLGKRDLEPVAPFKKDNEPTGRATLVSPWDYGSHAVLDDESL